MISQFTSLQPNPARRSQPFLQGSKKRVAPRVGVHRTQGAGSLPAVSLLGGAARRCQPFLEPWLMFAPVRIDMKLVAPLFRSARASRRELRFSSLPARAQRRGCPRFPGGAPTHSRRRQA